MRVSRDRMKEYLSKIHGSPCMLCKSNKWEISDQVFQVMEFDTDGLRIGGASYPIIPLTCMNCGNTYFINTLVAGLIDQPDKAEDKTAEDESPKG